MSGVSEGKRRIDRIGRPDFVEDIGDIDLAELRQRRDECRQELDHLSMLRRYVQSRAEILKGELARRHGDAGGTLVENLAQILSSDDHPNSSRGVAMRLHAPDDEMLLARRRVEKLVAESGVTDPSSLSDAEIDEAVERLKTEERAVSTDRADVFTVLELLQTELKRRFKDDPASVLA